jgi:hypothetical protein
MKPSLLSALALEGFSSAAKQRLIIGWLSIILVGVLIFWLPGGLPPTPWLLLGYLLIRWGTLQPALGSGIFLPFILLLFQSVLLLLAWAMVGLAIRREISVLNTLLAQRRVIRLRATMTATSGAAPANALAPKSQDLQAMSEEHNKNGSSKSTDVQIISPESEKQDDLFDVNMAVFELSSDSEEARVENKTVETAKPKDEDPIFVYGNPFEGELPEVFNYDMDLRREVQDLKSSALAKQPSTDARSAHAQTADIQSTKDHSIDARPADSWLTDER